MQAQKNILVVYAVDEEKIEVKFNGFKTYYCKTQIGKINAAMAVTEAIEKYSPSIVMNIGTSGAVHHEVGSIHVCCRFIDRDMEKVSIPGVCYTEDFTAECINAGLGKWGIGGLCNTGDSFLTTPEGTGDVFDMEAFASAAVCRKQGIPFIAVKYVTDKIGENSIKAWKDKLADARDALQTFIDSKIIEEGTITVSRTAKAIIEQYQLMPHPEGGYYKEVYRSKMRVSTNRGEQSALTSILYLLRDKEVSAFHRLSSPEIWYHHEGEAIQLYVIDEKGFMHEYELSKEPTGTPQVTVEPGCWFAARIKNGNGYTLLGCAVAPGFEFSNFEMGDKKELIKNYPELYQLINQF